MLIQNMTGIYNMNKKLIISIIIFLSMGAVYCAYTFITEYKENQFLEQNKEDIYNTYQQAWDYCQEHAGDRDENGILINGGNRFVEYCIGDYLEQKNEKYSKIYYKTWDKCIKTTDCMVDQVNCLIKTFEDKIK